MQEKASMGQLTQLYDGVSIFHDCVNVGLLQAGQRAFAIECGSGAVAESAIDMGCLGLDWVLATHYHRDSCWGLEVCRARGALVAVPEIERQLFEDVDRYWADDGTAFHRYFFRPSANVLVRAVTVDRALADGDMLVWNSYTITAVATPGHTDGSLSYVVDTGDVRYAFVGDLVYGEGQLWELWSLQGPIPHDPVGNEDYHAFCGRARQAADSLERLINRFAPTVLIPAHGPLIKRPAEALAALRRNIEALISNYFSVSSMRHYFPDWVASQNHRTFEISPGISVEAPSWFRIGARVGGEATTTRVIVAPSGRALVLDCGSAIAADNVMCWTADGTVTGVDAVWVSHYHDDHVGGIGELVRRTGCAVWAGQTICDILERPAAHCMPCLDPTPVPVDRVLNDGERIDWEGFALTAYDFPGQTLLHSALLVEYDGIRLLIGGDSFTPTGIDDYCSYNRNLLGQGQGYLYCLDVVERLRPTMLVNMHVEQPFTFSKSFLSQIRAVLYARERLFAAILPWDGCNFGLDPYWARCYPYRQDVVAGSKTEIILYVTNHGSSQLAVEAKLIAPPEWQVDEMVRGEIASGDEGSLVCSFVVPRGFASGRRVLSVRLRIDGRDLGAWTEAMVDVLK